MSALPTSVGQSFKTLKADQHGPTLSIELNTPAQGNVITETLLDELLTVLEVQDPAVRVIVLSGAGTDFCQGGDRSEYVEQLAQDPTGGSIRTSGAKARRVCESLSNNPAVTIARIHGKVIGAGLALALACDLRVAADTSTFRLPELALGLPTAWGGLLPRLLNEVGAARVRELIFTSRAFTAYEAQSLSILQNVVPKERLAAAVSDWTRPILRRTSAALRVTKLLLNAHGAAARLADVSSLDAELMAAVLAEARVSNSSVS
ncbi:enoyl-CoA hydratase/isomerase family protein [Streptomyces sp. NPDC002547]